jgi:6-phosphogluconate dehydrogenase
MASFGVIGLGVMGENLALNIEEHGFPVAVWNYERDWIDRFVQANEGKRIEGKKELRDFVAALERPRRMLIMIKAGAPVDSVLDSLERLVEPGDIVVDGGNSWYLDTQRRETRLHATGARFVGCGVSGGEEGARRGPCLMPGGERGAWELLKPVFEAIAARTEAGPCVAWCGPGGAGHFVKMVHNGIEYGDMQLIAEVWDLLRRVGGLDADACAEVFARWNRGRLESFLIEITAKILRVRDPESGRPLVELVLDEAGQKGTGKWTAQSAFELGVPIPTISAAIDARFISGLKAERVRAARLLPLTVTPRPSPSLERDLEAALYAAKLCSYAQGMNVIRAGAAAQGWSTELAEMARIWKGGCIIRARFLDEIRAAYGRDAQLPNLLIDDGFRAALVESAPALARVVALAAEVGVPAPSLSASLQYLTAYRTEDLPQSLTQAQRDAFGAHGYVRSDRPGSVHTNWLG